MRKIILLFIVVLILPLKVIFGEEIIKSFPAPGGYYAYGLTWDGTNLWCGEDWRGWIFQVDTANGAVLDSFQAPYEANHGLAWDGTYLWVAGDYTFNGFLFKMTSTGLVVDSIPSVAGDYPGGLTWDGTYLWVSMYYPHPAQIYRIDPTSGSVIDSILPQGLQPQGLAWDPGGPFIWNSMDDNDGDPERVWKLNPSTGETLFSFPTPNTRPRGLAWDGQYLWLVAQGPGGPPYVQYIYKIDPQGGGTPSLSLSDSNHDYSHTLIGVGKDWNLGINNVGSADLIVDSLVNTNGLFTYSGTYPDTLLPDSSLQVTVNFLPTNYGTASGTLLVFSNDPINGIQSVSLTGFGIFPVREIALSETLHDYEDIRVGADKRWFLKIDNQGATPLSIDSATSSSPRFALLDPWLQNISFPILIDSTESTSLPVWFSPITSDTAFGTLLIYSNDGDEPSLSVSLTGTGDGSPYPGGRVFWSYDAPGNVSSEYIRSIRSLDDINGDGVDEVIASSENDTLYCFHGNGSGIGDILWTSVNGNPWLDRSLVTIGDLDGDGFSDIVMGTVWGDRSVHAISGRTGIEIWVYDSHEYGNGGWFYEVSSTVDIDGDSLPDLLASAGDDGMGTGPNRAYCLSGRDGSKVWERPLNAAGFGIQPIGDMNGDAVPDVACGTGDTNPTVMGVWSINGATGDSLWFFEVGRAIWSVAPLEDITGDGKNEVIAGAMDGTLYALNGENGDSVWATVVEAFGILEQVRIIGDVNGSGIDDILVAGTISNFTCIEGSNGSVIWSLPSGDMNFTVSPISDLTGDGVDEVIGGSGFSSNWVYCIDGNNGDTLWGVPNDGATETVWFTQDIDGNGYEDVLSGSRNGKIMVISGGDPSLGISETSKGSNLLKNFYLSQNCPNPFNQWTTIHYVLPGESHVKLKVYNITGQLISTLVNERMKAGSRTAHWNGKDTNNKDLSSGIYFYKLEAGNLVSTKKMIFMKNEMKIE